MDANEEILKNKYFTVKYGGMKQQYYEYFQRDKRHISGGNDNEFIITNLKELIKKLLSALKKIEKEKPKEEPENKIIIKQEDEIIGSILSYSKNEPVDFNCYSGMTYYLFLEVLIRNKNDCFIGDSITLDKYRDRGVFNYYRSGNYGVDLDDLRNNDIIEQLLKKYKECANRKKILCVPLFKVEHANMIIFNPFLQQIEHYEPHGQSSKPYDNALKKMAEYFKNIGASKYTKNMKYSPSIESCPRISKEIKEKWIDATDYIKKEDFIGLQLLDGTLSQRRQVILKDGNRIKDTGGFCCMWSFLQMDFRLKYPKLPTNALSTKLVELAKDKPMEFFRNYIRGFTNEIMERLISMIGTRDLNILNNPGRNRDSRDRIRKIMENVMEKLWKEAGGK